MINKLKRFFKKEKGQGLVEYGLILALISVLSIGAVSTLGETTSNVFKKIDDAIIIVPPLDDESYEWIIENKGENYGYKSTNPKHTGIGYYRYTGNAKEVVIPHTIHGHKMTNYFKMFIGTHVEKVSHNNPQATEMRFMFNGSLAPVLDLSELDTSHVTTMHGMFESSRATSIDVSNFDTRKVESMQVMFYNAQARALDLSHFDTSNVKMMGWMFKYSAAKTLNLSSFDTGQVRSMEEMFHKSQATSLDLSSFDLIPSVSMVNMFDDSAAQSGLAKTQAYADRFNMVEDKPSALTFTAKKESNLIRSYKYPYYHGHASVIKPCLMVGYRY